MAQNVVRLENYIKREGEKYVILVMEMGASDAIRYHFQYRYFSDHHTFFKNAMNV